jgi:hypothetical protein
MERSKLSMKRPATRRLDGGRRRPKIATFCPEYESLYPNHGIFREEDTAVHQIHGSSHQIHGNFYQNHGSIHEIHGSICQNHGWIHQKDRIFYEKMDRSIKIINRSIFS